MEKLVKGIHHVSLKCCGAEAFAETVRFYRDVLGLEVAKRWGEGESAGAMLDTGSGLIELFANGTERLPQGAIRHLAFATDDVDACAAAVKRAGYPVFVEPKNIVLESEPPYPARIAFCTGPVGEQIELFQER